MTDVESKVCKFSRWLTQEMTNQGRDDSHGMIHFERVREMSLELAAVTKSLTEGESLVLQLAALCHDVVDHKYFAEESDMSVAKASMERALRERAGLTDDELCRVTLIADNISLSKELAGSLEEEALRSRACLDLRDFVSDADKLDALGIRGLERLAQYHLHVLRGEKLSCEYLRQMATDHILHRVKYLRTREAVRIGDRLIHETIIILASDVALNDIIRDVRNAHQDYQEGGTASVLRRPIARTRTSVPDSLVRGVGFCTWRQ